MTIADFNQIKSVLTVLDAQRPSRFGYTEAAVAATGANELTALVGHYVTEDSTQINSIPTPDLIGVDPIIINIGLRSQVASITRHTMNHFFGRLGLNLLKVTEKTKLLVENHLVNRYITPSGYIVEGISLGYTGTTVTITQAKSPLAADEPTTADTVLSMSAAVYNGNAGVMTGADKKSLDDIVATVNVSNLTSGKLLRYNGATGKVESATVAEASGALSGISTISMSGAINGLTISSGALSGISTIAMSGAINGLTISSGALSGISTITMSGAINGLTISSGALSGVTTLGMSDQLTSTVTGKAPFVVSSAYQVANLNASLLQGYSISTSGAYIPLLNGTNTWSGAQTIGAYNFTVDTNTLFVNSFNHRVGIGTTDPLTRLHVASDGANWASGVFAGSGGTDVVVIGNISNKASICAHNGTLNAWSALQINCDGIISGGNVIMGIGGNVGIGTTSPNAKLTVTETLEERATLYLTNTHAVGFGIVVRAGNGIGSSSGSYIASFRDKDNTEKAYIGYNGGAYFNGNVGIGTTDPGNYKLYVNGAIYALCTYADGIGITGQATNGTGGIGVKGLSTYGIGVRGISTSGIGISGSSDSSYGVYGYSTSNNGIYGQTITSGKAGVYGYTVTTGAFSVAGNTDYKTAYSSQFMKYGEEYSIIDAIHKNPFTIKRYLWEDSNYEGFFEFIGPYKEDIYQTFKLTHNIDGLFSVAGIALGLGIELLSEVDLLKLKVQKLEEQIILLGGTI